MRRKEFRYSRGTKLRAARPLFSFVRDRNMHARIALIIACPLDSSRLNIFFIIKLVSLSLSIFLASNTTAIAKSGALRMRNYSFEPSESSEKIIPYISRQSVLHSLSFVRSSRPFSPLPRFVISARNSRYEQKGRHSFQSDESSISTMRSNIFSDDLSPSLRSIYFSWTRR